ncbi:hypothetical protein BSKO_09068 [Bryopsis sp. KO-2023]|nr:hypothetical protein BSKO_09068 [Bryopsis sp. KO-2023]
MSRMPSRKRWNAQRMIGRLDIGSNDGAVGNMNDRSSRMHSGLTGVEASTSRLIGVQTHSLYLVDLAGSDRIARSQATGQAKSMIFMHVDPEMLSRGETLNAFMLGARVLQITLGEVCCPARALFETQLSVHGIHPQLHNLRASGITQSGMAPKDESDFRIEREKSGKQEILRESCTSQSEVLSGHQCLDSTADFVDINGHGGHVVSSILGNPHHNTDPEATANGGVDSQARVAFINLGGDDSR